MTIDQQAEKLHGLFCSLTGRTMRFTAQERYRWDHWIYRQWTEEDLALVVKFVKMKIAKRERREESLRLQLLIEPSRFEDDLLDARAWARKPVKTEKQRVLEATGRKAEDSAPARTPEEIMQSNQKMAAMLKKWREENLE